MDVAVGKINALAVSMPPRSGKSWLTCVLFPVWFLGNFPDKRIIVTTYGAELARDWGRKARNLMEEVGPELFGVHVDPNSSAADRWDLKKHGGGMVSAGIGGPIVGRGAHVAVVDDPYKNWEEAYSEAIRARIWDWFTSTLMTRIEPGGSIVITMQRWHTFDLIGRLQRESPDRWEFIKFAAVAGEDDPLGRKPGEPLWPERFSPRELSLLRNDLGSAKWLALYQQEPAALEGQIFQQQWFRYFYSSGDYYILQKTGKEEHVRQEDCWRFQTVDLAASTKSRANYFVLATWAVTPERDLLLLDLERMRVEGPEQLTAMRRSFNRWLPSVAYVEKTGFQIMAVQNMVREGLPVRGVNVDSDKVCRALSAAARYENEKIFHRRDAVWLIPFETELLQFPGGEYDDQVDVVSLACTALLSPASEGKFNVIFW